MSAPLRDHRFSPCRHPFQSCCLGRKPCSRASGQLNSVGDYSNSVRIAHGPSRLDGTPYHRVRVSADGAIEWTHAHLGLTPRTTLAHQTYHALRWTILATGPGTCFTSYRVNPVETTRCEQVVKHRPCEDDGSVDIPNGGLLSCYVVVDNRNSCHGGALLQC
jgi:hypothetical protein